MSIGVIHVPAASAQRRRVRGVGFAPITRAGRAYLTNRDPFRGHDGMSAAVVLRRIVLRRE